MMPRKIEFPFRCQMRYTFGRGGDVPGVGDATAATSLLLP